MCVPTRSLHGKGKHFSNSQISMKHIASMTDGPTSQIQRTRRAKETHLPVKRFAAAAAVAGALATHAWNLGAESAIPTSTNSYEGADPGATLVQSGNTLYGTTSEHAGAMGGACGSIFKVNTDGGNFAVLHFFPPLTYPHATNSDGGTPMAGLVLAGHTLYGTASGGGRSGCGTVFKINTDVGEFAVLHNFTSGAALSNQNGAHPMARLALSGRTLYG